MPNDHTPAAETAGCRCRIVGWSRDPYEPHIPAQAEWEQADDCPVHPLPDAAENDYADPSVREALRREWSHPEKYAEHEVIHALLSVLEESHDRTAWEVGLLRQVVATVPVGDQTVDFLHCVAAACIETRRTTPPAPAAGGDR